MNAGWGEICDTYLRDIWEFTVKIQLFHMFEIFHHKTLQEKNKTLQKTVLDLCITKDGYSGT